MSDSNKKVLQDVNTKDLPEIISANKLVVVSASWCGFSRRAKDALDKGKYSYTLIEADEQPERESPFQQALKKISSSHTFPQIFVNGTYYGGCDDTLQGIRSGDFAKKYNQ